MAPCYNKIVRLDILRPKEKFLILEITPAGANGLYMDVDEDRRITFENFEKNADLKKLLKSPAQRVAQKTWEGNHFFKSRRRIIAVADSLLATTIPVPIELIRDPATVKTRIAIAELENLIAQAMSKIFNGCRSEAAKRLKLQDLDAVLVGAKAEKFSVEGKAVRTPVGISGKKIALVLELTFTGRELFEALKPFFSAPGEFFFAEAPQVHLRALSRIRNLPLNLVVGDENGASLYIFSEPKDENAVLYREPIQWSFSAVTKAIADIFKVTNVAAEDIYCLYHCGGMSDAAHRFIKKNLESAIEPLFSEIEERKVKGPVYVDMPHPLPFSLPHRRGMATFLAHPAGEVLNELGFTADLGQFGERQNDVARPLLYFLEAYFDKSDSPINRKLRRRLHWLAI